MNRKISVCLLFILSLNAAAETWLQVSDDGDMIECPDAIEFKSSSYVILNDCYGFDQKEPVIESGEYIVHENYISFSERAPSQESFLGEDAKSQKLLLEKDGNSIKLTDGKAAYYFKVLGGSE